MLRTCGVVWRRLHLPIYRFPRAHVVKSSKIERHLVFILCGLVLPESRTHVSQKPKRSGAREVVESTCHVEWATRLVEVPRSNGAHGDAVRLVEQEGCALGSYRSLGTVEKRQERGVE